jgi:hypothetical protein
MKTEDHGALQLAHAIHRELSTAQAELAVRAAAACATLDVCIAEVRAMEQRRADAVASAKPNDVLALEGELLRKRVGAEIAQATATALTEEHDAAIKATLDAQAGVDAAARSVLAARRLRLATGFNDMFDRAMESFGEELCELCVRDELNTPVYMLGERALPPMIARALERMPKLNPYDVPVNLLRQAKNRWAEEFAKLTAPA